MSGVKFNRAFRCYTNQKKMQFRMDSDEQIPFNETEEEIESRAWGLWGIYK